MVIVAARTHDNISKYFILHERTSSIITSSAATRRGVYNLDLYICVSVCAVAALLIALIYFCARWNIILNSERDDNNDDDAMVDILGARI